MTKNPNDVRLVSVELLEELLGAAKWKAADFTKASPYRSTIDDIVRQTKDLLAQPADQQGEPVAWMVTDKGISKAYEQFPRWAADYLVEPLYIHAQPATAKVDERLVEATAFVQKLRDAAVEQPSVATGYLSDILDVLQGRTKMNTPQ